MLITSCQQQSSYDKGSFGYDLQFLQQHDSVVVLTSDKGKAQVVVSPKYQAKVFTSTADGLGGFSFGWVNYKAFQGKLDAHMNAYGGENRLWLGPEGGRFSLFFKAGDSMDFKNWKTPSAFDTEAWTIVAKNDWSVSMKKEMHLANYQNLEMTLSLLRTVAILNRDDIEKSIDLNMEDSVESVAYKTVNTVVNTGKEAWNEVSGMPCIWILDMMKNTPSTVIVVPYKTPVEETPFADIATTDYFGQIPEDRLAHTTNTIFLKADGKSRGKIGVKPNYAKPVLGSYDPQNKILTIVSFDLDTAGKYLNQEWNTSMPIFSGDAVNAYNDGPLVDGSQMGPFYEMESVSPAAFLQPNQSLEHKQTVYHFTGAEKGLDAICQKMLGVSLADIVKQFK
ncbi:MULTISPECIES: DUF6786 family protein [Chitinophagaceae]